MQFTPQGILSDVDIVANREKGFITIEPFDPKSLKNCSYDVRLGENYYRATEDVTDLNPWSEELSTKYWGQALLANEAEQTLLGLNKGDKYILLAPGETILAHTEEFIGASDHIVTMMKTRSSLRRSNISCCQCAGWGDIGFINRWCMEITNHSPTANIILPVGKRVAQIVFLYASVPSKSYEKEGKYQQGADIETIRQNWNASMLLPKLYLESD